MGPILGDHYVFFFFFVAIVFAAGYGGYGPGLLALVLSWLLADYLFLASGPGRHFFDSKFQLAFAFLTVGLAITVLGGSLRAARERARVSSSELHCAFEAQKAEREWLQITLASITDAVITTDPEGQVISLNPVAAGLTGWSVDDALGRPLREDLRLVQQSPRKNDELPVLKAAGGGEAILSDDEAVLIALDGTARSVEHSAAPIRDSGGKVKGVVIIFRDVTERHRVERAKRESEERFRQLADHIDDVFWS
jgi:PAS domain S-box-containing protein